MISHWNRNFGIEIYVPRRPEENERREINKTDLQLKRKERESSIGGGYFRDFGDEILQRITQNQMNREETHRENETHRDAESSICNNSEETVATHEPGAYLALPVQEYRDGPIEEIAVHYELINRVVEQNETQQVTRRQR